ncbi:MAG: amino acid permease [Parachlamydiales bacterium]
MKAERSLSIVGGSALIAGTCIGAGALALPITTFAAGFFPSLALFVICWLAMCLTGLLYLEVVLWMPGETNILSMTERMLGKVGRYLAWFVYLYLFYSLTVAYIAGSGDALALVLGGELSRPLLILLFVLLFGALVYRGTRAIEGANFLFVLGMAIAYITLIAVGLPHVQPPLLTQMGKLSSALPFLPIILLSFGYQGTVPSLVADMDSHPRRARLAIIIGSFLPFIAYTAWQALILGLLPQSALAAAGPDANPVSLALSHSRPLLLIGECFAFFALASSFLGVGIGLRDFIADGFKVKKSRPVRLAICLLIYGPAFALSLTDPRLFILALKYGGGIGGVLLLGILPVVLVWVGRYRQKLKGPYHLFGGRTLLLLLGLFFLLTLVLELL